MNFGMPMYIDGLPAREKGLSSGLINRLTEKSVLRFVLLTANRSPVGPSLKRWVMRKTWWRHQMETFCALLAFVMGIHRSPGNSPHKGQCRGDLMFSLICAWINDWINHRGAGDLRRHHAHYDVTVMIKRCCNGLILLAEWKYSL